MSWTWIWSNSATPGDWNTYYSWQVCPAQNIWVHVELSWHCGKDRVVGAFIPSLSHCKTMVLTIFTQGYYTHWQNARCRTDLQFNFQDTISADHQLSSFSWPPVHWATTALHRTGWGSQWSGLYRVGGIHMKERPSWQNALTINPFIVNYTYYYAHNGVCWLIRLKKLKRIQRGNLLKLRLKRQSWIWSTCSPGQFR